VVTDLPEQLIAQAEFLVRNTTPNEANLRRAVSSAYYALFSSSDSRCDCELETR
jgi:hypothetical protein